MTAGRLIDRIAFDAPVETDLPGGVTRTGWVEAHNCRAQAVYTRGVELIEAARKEGRPAYKIRIRQCGAARAITTDWRARDVRRGLADGEGPDDTLPGTRYAIREADAITDRAWIYLVIVGGLAA